MLPSDLRRRESALISPSSFCSRYQVTANSIERLGLLSELDGHSGCVNCLQWNRAGDLLASGSDDLKVVLWDPFTKKKRHEITTKHHGNIFSVKFLPWSEHLVATCSGDKSVHLHDLARDEAPARIFSQHFNRVKRLEVGEEAHLLFSASEDGLVLQMDLRGPQDPEILVNLNGAIGRQAEAKCLAINPTRPQYLAVGANDPFVRLYDRRMIKPLKLSHEGPMDRGLYYSKQAHFGMQSEDMLNSVSNCVQYFTAGHLPLCEQLYKRRLRHMASTYVTFSPDGNELLVNMGGEQVYLFSLGEDQDHPSKHFVMKPESKQGLGPRFSARSLFREKDPSSPGHTHQPPLMHPEVLALKLQANEEYEKKQYTRAIALYNLALLKERNPVLLANRAAALMKRNFDGDVYAAVRDCYDAVALDSAHVKAHLRLARCLLELKLPLQSKSYLALFKHNFPELACSNAYIGLEQDVRNSIQSRERSRSSNRSSPIDSADEDPVLDGRSSSSSSLFEDDLQCHAVDYTQRFCGHCNTTTDIKEANYFGSAGQYIVAGSDEGYIFCWDRQSANIVAVLNGDESIVNCLQGHPTDCLLATSGIESVIRLWAPLPEDGSTNIRRVTDVDKATAANQRRMNADPFETLLLNMGYNVATSDGDGDGSSDERDERDSVQCRPS